MQRYHAVICATFSSDCHGHTKFYSTVLLTKRCHYQCYVVLHSICSATRRPYLRYDGYVVIRPLCSAICSTQRYCRYCHWFREKIERASSATQRCMLSQFSPESKTSSATQRIYIQRYITAVTLRASSSATNATQRWQHSVAPLHNFCVTVAFTAETVHAAQIAA